jgi:protocatechuate 3,4-dioxygenase beta subunit
MFLACTAILAQAGEITGVVIDQATGAPVERAQVTLAPRDQQGSIQVTGSLEGGASVNITPAKPAGAAAVLTDAEGRYKFTGVAPGIYTVQARKAGYFSGPSATVELEGEESVTADKLRLTPPSVVAGVVLDEEGEPVQGVQVQLLARRMSRNEVIYTGWGGTATDDQGRFRIASPQSGKVVISARPFMPLLSTKSPGQEYVTTYYPEALEPGAAQMVEIKPGVPVENLKLKLRASPVFAIRGRVLDADGQPLPQAAVSVRPKTGDLGAVSPAVRQTGAGGFEIPRMPPGEYTVMAHHFDSRQQRAASAEVSVRNADVSGLELRMARGVKVSGVVDVPLPPMPVDGPSDIVPVEGMDHRQSMRVFLTPSARDGSGRSYSIETREDGTFTLADVQPGRYEISGFQYGTYLASVTVGGEERLGREVEVREGMGELRIEYRADGGMLNVRLEGARPAGERPPVLVIMPVNPELRRQPFLLMYSIGGRSAELRSLRPGDYYLWMLPAAGPFEMLYDPEFVARLEKAAKRVKIEPDGLHEVSLPVTEWPAGS